MTTDTTARPEIYYVRGKDGRFHEAAPLRQAGTLDHDTMLWVLEELQIMIHMEHSIRDQAERDDNRLRAIICDDRAASFERFRDHLSREYNARR